MKLGEVDNRTVTDESKQRLMIFSTLTASLSAAPTHGEAPVDGQV